jgi:hypothetical protein
MTKMLHIYYNPSLGLATKVKACKGVGQKWSPRVTFHAPENVGECEGMNPTLPNELSFWELESRWAPEFSESNYKGQNSLDWRIPYTIGKLLELKCLKWPRMTHFRTYDINYGQKTGRESNCQFNSRPIKVKNCPYLFVCRWCATYRWRAINKGYNFALDLTSIGGLHKK